eukprot:7238_1
MAANSKMKQIKAIKQAIKTNNIITLKQLAIKHGLLSDKLRKKAWPLILEIDTTQKRQKQNGKIIINDEYQLIECDIKRTHMNCFQNKSEKRKTRACLSKILHRIFDGNDDMDYIQGFNDVASVLYTVCHNIELTQNISRKVAETLLCDFMVRNQMNESQNATINVADYALIIDIIELYDETLTTVVTHDDFIAISISWLITWFAHQIKDVNTISRIYDYCLCSDKCISSYLCAALIIYLKDDVLLATKENNQTLFEYFGALEWDQVDFDRVIEISQLLYKTYNKAQENKGTEISTINGNTKQDIWSLGIVVHVLSKM